MLTMTSCTKKTFRGCPRHSRVRRERRTGSGLVIRVCGEAQGSAAVLDFCRQPQRQFRNSCGLPVGCRIREETAILRPCSARVSYSQSAGCLTASMPEDNRVRDRVRLEIQKRRIKPFPCLCGLCVSVVKSSILRGWTFSLSLASSSTLNQPLEWKPRLARRSPAS